MATLTTTIEVARPPEEVFAYVTDPTTFGEWQANVISGHMDGSGPQQAGARCVTTRRIGWAERTVTSELTHVDPPRRWGVRGVDGPVRAVVEVSVDPIDDGRASRLTISIEFQGHGIGKLLVPLAIRPQARREMPANLKRLKQRVEGHVKDRQGD
jgi:uncharacterized protein YndB with AHSA1/START domain